METNLQENIEPLERCDTLQIEVGNLDGLSAKEPPNIARMRTKSLRSPSGQAGSRTQQTVRKDDRSDTSAVKKLQKFDINELLDGTFSSLEMMDIFDDLLFTILQKYDTYEILTITVEKAKTELLRKNKESFELINKWCNNGSKKIVAKLLHIARQCKSIDLAMENEKMVYVPESFDDFDILIDKLTNGEGPQSLLQNNKKEINYKKSDNYLDAPKMGDVPKRSLDIINDDNNQDDDNKEEQKEDKDIPEDKTITTTELAKNLATVPSTSEFDAKTPKKERNINELVLSNGTKYKETKQYSEIEKIIAKMRESGNIFGFSKKKPKQIADDEKLEEQIELTDKTKNNITIDDEDRPSIASPNSSMFGGIKKKNPHPRVICEGCKNGIDLNDVETQDNCIVYFVQALMDINNGIGSEFYFHDEYCVILRRLKESIRRFVTERELPKKRQSKNIGQYIYVLYDNFNELISMQTSELVRPYIANLGEGGGMFSSADDKKKRQIEAEKRDSIRRIRHHAITIMNFNKIRRREKVPDIIDPTEILKKEEKEKKQHEINESKDNINIDENDEAMIIGDDGNNNDDDNKKEDILDSFDEEEDDDDDYLFRKLPISLQYHNPLIYGEALWLFVSQQLLSKQLNEFWLLIAFISGQLPTMQAVEVLLEYIAEISKVKDIENIDIVCTTIIQRSTYPIATCLVLSDYLNQLAQKDLSRSEEFEEIGNKYVKIANELVAELESDHLLTILLEAPTDLYNKSIFELAIEYGLDEFFDNNRIERIMTQMWSEFEILDPNQNYRTSEIDLYGILKLLLFKPNKFYYAAVGRYWTQSSMYIAYVVIVTCVLMQKMYYFAEPAGRLEIIMWIFNAGYVGGEITEVLFVGLADYLSEASNYFDILIMINWGVIFGIRFFSKKALCIGTPEEIQACYDKQRQSDIVAAYQFCFALQIIVLYSRMALIFLRTRSIGPFIGMISGMIDDIRNFAVVVILFSLGFYFGLYFLIGGDIREDEIDPQRCTGNPNDIPTLEDGELILYTIQIFLGQQEWGTIDYQNPCLGVTRARMAQFYASIYSILGTVLLLNLLIAMMSSTYENKREAKSKEVNFSRTEETFLLTHRSAIIPPPLNIIVVAFCIVWLVFELIIGLFTCCSISVNVSAFTPVSIDYVADDAKREAKRLKHSGGRTNSMTNNDEKKKDDDDDDDDEAGHKRKFCCGLFKKFKSRGEHFKKFGSDWSRMRKYCSFCRCYMTSVGDIQDYFVLFKKYKLDKADTVFLRKMLRFSGLCPKCFRPYRIDSLKSYNSNRLMRWQVILEILSFYVFCICVYLPLAILIVIPALLQGLLSFLTETLLENNKLDIIFKKTDKLYEKGTEERYQKLLSDIIESENTSDTDVLKDQVTILQKKLIQIKIQQNKQQRFAQDSRLKLEDMFGFLKGTKIKVEELFPELKTLQSKLEDQDLLDRTRDENTKKDREKYKEQQEILKNQTIEIKNLQAQAVETGKLHNKQINDKDIQINELNNIIKKNENDINGYKGVIENKDKKIESLEGQINELNKIREEKIANISQLKLEKGNQLAEFEKERSRLKEEINDRDKNIQELKGDIEGLKKTSKINELELNDKIKDLKNEKENIENNKKLIEKELNNIIDELNKKFENERKEKQELYETSKDTESKLNDTINELKSNVAQLKQEIIKIKVEKEIKQEQKNLNVLKMKSVRLQATVSNLEKHAASLGADSQSAPDIIKTKPKDDDEEFNTDEDFDDTQDKQDNNDNN